MRVFRHIHLLKAYLNGFQNIKLVGLVPTMGALHSGHEALLEACKKDNDITVCSIFVNPTQFNSQEDLKNYPRSEDQDLTLLEKTGCDVVFIPEVSEIYPEPPSLTFDFGYLESTMEGAHRPGHFNGVALVVSKLFNIIEPDKAYFGQKDYQQFKIISQLANDLLFDVDLIAVPTVREPSGLAKSSRNSRLSDKGRSLASKIHDVLSSLETRLLKGDTFSILKPLAVSELEHSDLKVEYLEFVNEETMYPINCKNENVLAVLCIAVTVDGIRLIDNKIF